MSPSDIRQLIADEAIACIGKPYRRKGHGPHRFDCAGLVGWCCLKAGVKVEIPETYDEEARDDTLLREFQRQSVRQMGIREARSGDLALMRIGRQMHFSGSLKSLNHSHHCGVFVEVNGVMHMVHAHRPNKKVRIERVADLTEPITAAFSVTD